MRARVVQILAKLRSLLRSDQRWELSPENCISIARVDEARVTKRNIAVDLAMNEENWNDASCD
ncbi:MAG: hypothetical protein ABSF15_07505 [Candidatus Sulfotelmatobacter sp.]|jgi:hypothetical protein